MGVDIVVDGKRVYHSETSVCQMSRTDAANKEVQKPKAFNFSNGPPWKRNCVMLVTLESQPGGYARRSS